MVFVVFLIAVLVFAVSAVAGGGAGLVLVPLLRILLPVAQVPAALSIGTATGSLARIATFRRDIRWDVVRWFVPAALPMAALGAWSLSRFEAAYVELLIGMFLLANLPAIFRSPPAATTREAQPLSPVRVMALGALAGLISGFTGAVGLLFNHVYTRMGLRREELIATRAANEVALHILKISLYATFGLLGKPALLVGALIALAAIVSTVAMRRLLPFLYERLFRMVSHVAMVLAGAAMFTMSSGQILALHRAWASHVEIGDEHEFQLYWGGHRRFVVEFEEDGTPVLERRIAIEEMPARWQAEVRAIAHGRPIEMIEEVIGPGGRYIEIYIRHGRTIDKIELRR